MPQPFHNPFYPLLLAACFLLLITMFVYVVGWYYVPSPDRPMPVAPLPSWMKWIDRNAFRLICGEVLAIVVLSGLTMGLDRWFEPPAT